MLPPTLHPVHFLRICLLLLMAALLPVRGAMAVAMPCAAPSPQPVQVQVQVQQQVAGPERHHREAVHPHQGEDDHAGHASHPGHASHAGHSAHAVQAHEAGSAPADPAAHAGPMPGDAATAVSTGHSSHDHGATGKCSTCTACCSTPPLASAIMGMAAQPPLATVFPEARTPVPVFQSSGPDRPPRTT